MSAAPAPHRRITLRREFEAPVEEVWALWTTRTGLESWWGPEGFETRFRRLEVWPGGEFEYEMTATDPALRAVMTANGMPVDSVVRGRYTEVRRAERLAYVNLVDFVPGTPAFEVEVRVEFSASGERSRLVLVTDVLHNEEWTERAVMGHTSQLNRLERALTRRDPAR